MLGVLKELTVKQLKSLNFFTAFFNKNFNRNLKSIEIASNT
jgi:hypothetical protein